MFATGPIEDGYVRYLERRLRAEFPFAGSPLAISVRTRDKVKV
jgi:GTP-binding protein